MRTEKLESTKYQSEGYFARRSSGRRGRSQVRYGYTVREKGSNHLISLVGDNLDYVVSRHRTETGAQRVVDRANKRAKRRFGSTGFTTLYVYREPEQEQED